MSLVHEVALAHRALPVWLKLPAVVLTCLLLTMIGGLGFTLPPGPLCDEGMVLFMEGGCDWGPSNIFFFTKLGLLITTALVALGASTIRGLDRRGLLPHVVVLASFATWPILWSDRCDTYYSHPNGNFAQLIVEQSAFALLVLAWIREGALVMIGGLLVLNAALVGVFYVWLSVTDHWTWLHTGLVAGTLLLLVLPQGSMLKMRR